MKYSWIIADYQRGKSFYRPVAGGFLLVLLLLIGAEGASGEAMYLCREKGGAMNFTNAPTGANCQPYALSQTGGFREPMVPMGGKRTDSTTFDNDIRRIGRMYQVDPTLIKAVIQAESDFNHRAVSRKGALGLMQLMPDTARELNVTNPFNPRENIDGGTRYLRQLLDSFNGNLTLSLAAYNAGPGLVSRTGGVPKIPETQLYVTKVIQQYKDYKKEKNNAFLLVRE